MKTFDGLLGGFSLKTKTNKQTKKKNVWRVSRPFKGRRVQVGLQRCKTLRGLRGGRKLFKDLRGLRGLQKLLKDIVKSVP